MKAITFYHESGSYQTTDYDAKTNQIVSKLNGCTCFDFDWYKSMRRQCGYTFYVLNDKKYTL